MLSRQINPHAYPNVGDGPEWDGMTLRDWFAGMAMAHLLQTASPEYTKGACNLAITARSYVLADLMLKERSKECQENEK